MSQKTDEVKARFGGRDLVFKIERFDLISFERAINRPVIALFEQFGAGRWTAHDVQFILNWSAPYGLAEKPRRQDQIDVHSPNAVAAMKEYLATRQQIVRGEKPAEKPATFVEATVQANGIGRYVSLAHAVLAAALYGIPEDAGQWSDEEEAVDDEA